MEKQNKYIAVINILLGSTAN